MEQNEIKALVPIKCPSCNHDVVVCFKTTAPQITGVLTVPMIEKAKTDAALQIASLNIPDAVKQETLKWIESEDTIFGPDDIPSIVDNMKKQNGTPAPTSA